MKVCKWVVNTPTTCSTGSRPPQLAVGVHPMETIIPPDEDRDTLSNAESKAITEADEWLMHRPPIPHEEILADFGLAP